MDQKLKVKRLRVMIDQMLKELKVMRDWNPHAKELEIAHKKLTEARMWLGESLNNFE